MQDAFLYRPGVGLCVFNPQGLILAGHRQDSVQPAWQMPQGGIDANDMNAEAAMWRELYEELGITQALCLAKSQHQHRYDFPPTVAARIYNGQYKGQQQTWFLLLYEGADNAIVLGEEFSTWEWAKPHELLGHIVAFKRPVYEAVLAEFRPLIEAYLNDQHG